MFYSDSEDVELEDPAVDFNITEEQLNEVFDHILDNLWGPTCVDSYSIEAYEPATPSTGSWIETISEPNVIDHANRPIIIGNQPIVIKNIDKQKYKIRFTNENENNVDVIIEPKSQS